MLSQRQTQLTRIELETLLDERFNAFGQQLLKQILDEVVTDNTRLDGVVGLLNHIVSQLDLLGGGSAAPAQPAARAVPAAGNPSNARRH